MPSREALVLDVHGEGFCTEQRSGVALRPPVAHHPSAVLIVILLKNAPGATALLMLTLVIALYLTAVELRELRPHWKWWAWWTSLVFLTHFVGYLALRIYVALHRRNRARA